MRVAEYDVVALGALAERERHVPGILDWVLEAGQPYYDWVFGSAEAARVAVEQWIQRPSSEISLQRVRLVRLTNGTVVGGFIALTGDELRQARLQDAASIVASHKGEERTALLERLKTSRNIFRAPEAEEFYLSKMGVLPELRRGGYGTAIVEAFRQTGRQLGYQTFCLDVAARNLPARELYKSAGFSVVGESAIPETDVAYVAMTADEARTGRTKSGGADRTRFWVGAAVCSLI